MIEEEDECAEYDECCSSNHDKHHHHHNHNESSEELPLIRDVDRSKFGVINPGEMLSNEYLIEEHE